MKGLVFFTLCVLCLFYYTGNTKNMQKKLEQEYKAKIASAEVYSIAIPDVPPANRMDLPESVVRRLRRSLRSANPEEAFKAIEILWKNQDPAVIPVLQKLIKYRTDECWSNCAAKYALKERSLDLVSRDISQLNFELVKLAVSDRNKNIRLKAINTISGYFTDEALAVMNHALNDRDSSVRTAAIDGIMTINDGIKAARQEQIDRINKEYKDKTMFGARFAPKNIMDAVD